jgi:hypothetical protein
MDTTPSLLSTRESPANRWVFGAAGEPGNVGLNGMDDNKTGGPAGAPESGHSERPLGRGLEDISHLFLSRKTGGAAASDQTAVRSPEPASLPPGSRGGITLLRPAAVTREQLAIILSEFCGALEEGLRPIDANIPCDSSSEIDLLAVDRASQLTIIDFDTTSNDGLLLRGIGHFDWLVRNMPNIRRIQASNFSLQPRLFLLAPQFSPLLRSVARQITRPQIHWVRYHTVHVSGAPGILFEPVVGE